MPLEITIEKLVAMVKIAVGRHDNIQAFGELWIHIQGEADPIFKVRGFTIRLKEFGGKKVLSVVFPAYPVSIGFQTSFIAVNKSLWEDINKLFIDALGEQTGGASANELTEHASEEITEEDWDKIG
ncbi:MAG: hypothetical protein V1808_02130 [Candidatus Daviesbacteria bacterium]